jgi:CheY-like chemotaxis protein
MKKALVIDDNQQSADTVCRMLELLGLESQAAYGSRDGMLVVKEYTPDIIFLDINMPGLSGLEVLAYMKRHPSLERVPVVIVTSDDQPETAVKAHKTGALLVIVKPVTLEALENTLHKAGIV